MFDFFKDVFYELNGLDGDVIKEEQRKKLEEKKKNRFIFSKSGKVIVFIFGILYLIIGFVNVVASMEKDVQNGFQIVRFVLLACCDISCLTCLAIGKKETEIAALILVVLFVLIHYFTPLFL